MEYLESLLEEYYQLSVELDANGGPVVNPRLYDEILSVEDEICFEVALPISEANRQLFRFIDRNKSREIYIQESIQKLSLAKSKYTFHSKDLMLDVFKAA